MGNRPPFLKRRLCSVSAPPSGPLPRPATCPFRTSPATCGSVSPSKQQGGLGRIHCLERWHCLLLRSANWHRPAPTCNLLELAGQWATTSLEIRPTALLQKRRMTAKYPSPEKRHLACARCPQEKLGRNKTARLRPESLLSQPNPGSVENSFPPFICPSRSSQSTLSGMHIISPNAGCFCFLLLT